MSPEEILGLQNHKKEFCFVAMRRSGHHAVVNWLCRQLRGKTVFINNFRSWLQDSHSYRCIFEYRDGLLVRQKGLLNEVNFSDIDNLVYNFEDIEFHKSFTITPKAIKVLVLRDAINMLASRMKSPWVPNENWKDLWISNAQSFLNEEKGVFINFNKWRIKTAYRKVVSSQLDVEFNDAGLNEIMDVGGGSSFQGLNVNFKQLFRRYNSFLTAPLMRNLLEDDFAMDLNRQIFGFLPILI